MLPPTWLPYINGVPPTLFADFTTEGVSNHYYYNGSVYSGASSWLSAVGATFSGPAGYRTNSSGLLAPVSINALRFDFDPISLVSKGILQEAASTNQCPQSGSLTNPAWGQNNATVSGGVTGPDGLSSAFHITETNTTGTHYNHTSALNNLSGDVTFSAYLKAAERNFAFFDDGSGNETFFDILNGLVLSASGGVTGSISNAGNGWFRCSMKKNYGVSTAVAIIIGISTDGSTINYAGTNGNGIFATFAQIENLGAATSYTPTTGSTSTRSADTLTINPLPANSVSFPGTMIVKAYNNFDTATGSDFATFSDGSGHSVGVRFASSGILAETQASGAANIQATSSDPGLTQHALAFAWNQSDYSATADGITVVTNSNSQTPPTLTRWDSLYGNFNGYGGFIDLSEFAWWNNLRVSDSLLQKLSQGSSLPPAAITNTIDGLKLPINCVIGGNPGPEEKKSGFITDFKGILKGVFGEP